MNTRPIRNRKVFRLESLEVRNAPSSFGVMAHAAVAVHQVHAAAHLSHLSVTQSTDKRETPEVKSATDKRVDAKGIETVSPDKTTSPDTTNNETKRADSTTNQ